MKKIYLVHSATDYFKVGDFFEINFININPIEKMTMLNLKSTNDENNYQTMIQAKDFIILLNLGCFEEYNKNQEQ